MSLGFAAALKLDEAAEVAKIAERVRELLRSHLPAPPWAGRRHFRRRGQRRLCRPGCARGGTRTRVGSVAARARFRFRQLDSWSQGSGADRHRSRGIRYRAGIGRLGLLSLARRGYPR